eukprot:TRINITY_DN30897_c0_g1_i2.p1 TRINITY_DN30897_c0_g1~~TRINITY_DN30897_c0_g1_i2.p1  ORF type:complete len:467 (-),score=85.92 TRINITY_DN30897_c0_g1_i2:290-1690(-)
MARQAAVKPGCCRARNARRLGQAASLLLVVTVCVLVLLEPWSSGVVGFAAVATPACQPAVATDGDDVLGADLLARAKESLPSPRLLKARLKALEQIRGFAHQVLGVEDGVVEVVPYGSSANGFGEVTSDVDAAIVVHDEQFMADASKEKTRARHAELLAGILRMCRTPKHGWLKDQFLPKSRIPLLSLRKGKLMVDLTCRCLPVHNTRLLRYYGEMHEAVRPLVLAVKRSAKEAGLVGASLGWLSSYSWTLMVIYYLQRRGILPSLQALKAGSAEAQAPEAFVQDDKGRKVNVVFSSPEEAEGRWTPNEVESNLPLGELFRGFFTFYGREYKWGDEVVCVRHGRRLCFSDMVAHSPGDEFTKIRAKRRSFEQIHIEDPIEINRDLNFPLSEISTCTLRDSFISAEEALKRCTSLDQLVPMRETSSGSIPQRSRPKAKARPKARGKAKAKAKARSSPSVAAQAAKLT